MMELVCAVQKYAWGKLGSSSEVASLRSSASAEFEVAPDSPYAELWMGTHPNGPSRLEGGCSTLLEHIKADPRLVLGDRAFESFGADLPFLFKVLSVNKALSIQAHPDKKHARELHSKRPDVYKDPNHKPEMAIALTEFEGLCGFRPFAEIKAFLRDVPELTWVIGTHDVTNLLEKDEESGYGAELKAVFTGLMNANRDALKQALESIEKRVGQKAQKDPVDELFLRLVKQYPGDVGCLVIYFVNHVKLQPGEAMFLGPNLIHAYLSGDCMECMACSDNVVRAGLTPKLIDVPTLCSMLEYKCSAGDNRKFGPKEESSVTEIYEAPVPDFSVAKIKVCPGDAYVPVPTRSSASIVIFIRGCGSMRSKGREADVARGKVFFLPASEHAEIRNKSAETVLAFQAFC